MYLKSEAGFKIQDNLSGRSMEIMKLNLVKGNNKDEDDDAEYGTAPADDNNHGIMELK